MLRPHQRLPTRTVSMIPQPHQDEDVFLPIDMRYYLFNYTVIYLCTGPVNLNYFVFLEDCGLSREILIAPSVMRVAPAIQYMEIDSLKIVIPTKVDTM